MIKLSDYIANYIAGRGVQHVFMLTGGGAMHLNDSFGKHPDLQVVFNHHEQASAMAAESYARLTNLPAVVNVTTGPGGINALNGVFGAWTDSIPMVVISGQVRYDTTVRNSGLPLRQLGDQEYDIVKSAEPMTKYAVMVTDPASIRYHLEKAFYYATAGRPGPVWLDIPMNVQGAMIDAANLKSYDYPLQERQCPVTPSAEQIKMVLAKLGTALRPVILVGTGVRLSGAYDSFLELIDKLAIPVVTAFNAHDVLVDDHPLYVGRAGTVGDRAGNFAVQNADVLLVLGCRLNIRQISYNWQQFSRASYKICVDIDKAELMKPTVRVDLPIHSDLAEFIPMLGGMAEKSSIVKNESWLGWCRERKQKYPVVQADYWHRTDSVNPYCFIDRLGALLSEEDIIVTANATACIAAFQALRIKRGQRLYSNSGSASMGYDLPAAIGACVASGGRRVICLAGDGSFQQNSQELATIRYLQLPIKLFVLNNNGYHSIRQTQQNFFAKPYVGVCRDSGLFFPHLNKLAEAYEMPYTVCRTHDDLTSTITQTLCSDGPSIGEVMITVEQPFSPKLSSRRLTDGRMVSSPLEDMAPFLSREELKENMLIDLVREE